MTLQRPWYPRLLSVLIGRRGIASQQAVLQIALVRGAVVFCVQIQILAVF